MSCQLVKFLTRDGIQLDGVLHQPAVPSGRAAVLVHGTGDNFYGSAALESLVEPLLSNGYTVLRTNNRAHDGINTAQGRLGRFRSGAAYERVDDCRHDLNACIEFALSTGSSEVLLCGHSMGAIKCLYAQSMEPHEAVSAVIAISPPRLSYRMIRQSEYVELFDETFAEAKDLAERGFGNRLLDVRFPFPMIISAAAYVDKYGEAERFNILRFADRVPQPVHFVYGSLELQLTMFAGLPELVRQARSRSAATDVTVIDGANHNYAKRELQLGRVLIDWLNM